MKKKIPFFPLLLSVCLLFSLSACALAYTGMHQAAWPDEVWTMQNFGSALSRFMAEKAGTELEITGISEGEKTKLPSASALQTNLQEAALFLEQSPNFFWQVRLEGKTSGSETLPPKEQCIFAGKAVIKKGKVQTEGGLARIPFSPETLGELAIPIGDVFYDAFQARLPDGMELEIRVPAVLIPDTGIIYATFHTWHPTYQKLVGLISAAMIVLAGIVCAFDKEQEKQAPLYSWVWNGDPFLVLCTIILGTPALGAAFFVLMLSLGTSLPVATDIPLMTGFGAGFLVLTTLFFFWIKRVAVTGPIQYWKQTSRLDAGLNRLSDWYASGLLADNREVRTAFGINLILLLIVLLTANPFLAFLYGLAMMAFTWKLAKTANKDWNVICRQAEQLADGNYETEAGSSAGIFEKLQVLLQQIQEGLKATVEKEVQATSTKNELIANVSHDLKTPLTGLKNYSELLQDCHDEEQARDYARQIACYTDRLTNLVNDLFDVSKAAAGNLELRPEVLCLDQLIEQAAAESAQAMEEKKLETIFQLTPITISADPDKTIRIFDNLFSNIAKYALEGTRVYVSLEEKDGMAVTTLRNISKEPLNLKPEEILQRFVRGDKARHESGAGLGLAIVNSFVQVQNGTFQIEMDGDLFKAIIAFPAAK